MGLWGGKIGKVPASGEGADEAIRPGTFKPPTAVLPTTPEKTLDSFVRDLVSPGINLPDKGATKGATRWIRLSEHGDSSRRPRGVGRGQHACDCDGMDEVLSDRVASLVDDEVLKLYDDMRAALNNVFDECLPRPHP